jgi:hypothetical protein
MASTHATGKVVDDNVAPRPYPARKGQLLRNKEGVSGEWLTEMMQYKYPGVVASNFELVQLFDSHTTKMRIKVEWNDAGKKAGLPENLCLKSNWSTMFNDVDICAIEARFYHNLRDHMKVPIPICYYSDWDDDGSGEGFIVLEDLIDRGGKFGHSTQLPGPDGVETALKGLAKLHGGLWDSPLLPQQKWLQTSMRTPVDHDQIRIMWHWIEENLREPNFCALAPKHYLDDPRRVERAYDKLVEFERAFEAPYCVILGDCHQGNTYILPSGERMWLDWQLVRRGRPWRDLTYFMVGSLTIEERRKYQRDMIALYRESLVATGAQNVISLEEIWEHYRRWVMYGIQAWVANMDSWGQNGLPMNERFFAAGEDLGTWKLLLNE